MELITADNAAGLSNELLETLRDGGAEVSAMVEITDIPAESDAKIASLVTVLEKAVDKFNYGSQKVRFPRTHLVTHVASLELSRPPSGEKVDALLAKLREYWARPGTDDGRTQNILASVLQAVPNPGPMAAALVSGVGRRNFRLWLWGIPGVGGGCRWLRRQRNGVDFKTFLLRLTPEGRRERPLNVEALVARAFLEDLRVAFQPWLWDPRTWNLCRRPVLILDGLDDSLPELLDKARTQARDRGGKPDPLLIVQVPAGHAGPPRKRFFTSRAVPAIGDPRQVAYQRPNKPVLSLALSTVAIASVLVVAIITPLGVLSVPRSHASRVSSASRPTRSATHAPVAQGVLTASGCTIPADSGSETQVVAWKDDAGDTECVGFSGSSFVFKNPDFGTNAQQVLQETRMTSDQQQIFTLNNLIDAVARNPVPGSPGVYEIVYFAGLTESPLDEYDSAEAEEMEGLLAAQQSVYGNAEKPQLKVIIANGGAKMQDAAQVAQMIIKRFRGDKNFLGVVGLDRSTGDVKEAIREFGAAGIPMLATTLSADGIGGGSQDFFSLSPTNTAEARLMLAYIQRAVPRYFEQPASVYPSNGFISAQHIVVYQPTVTSQSNSNDADLYISTLVSDLQTQAKNYPGLPRLVVTEDLNDPRLCGAATVDIYAGRHDRPLDTASESKNDDFTQFLQRIGLCKKAMPFVIADDGISRFVADPADRANLDAGPLPISYVTKGINILSTGTECLSTAGAAAVTTQPTAEFCAQYAKIATGLRAEKIHLLWTGERVGLAYDAAQMFLQAAEAYWRTGSAITREEIPAEFENPGVGYSLVTGSVNFTATSHTGLDTPQGIPVAIVRILISDPTALPACAFTGFDGDQLNPIPNLDNQQEACVR